MEVRVFAIAIKFSTIASSERYGESDEDVDVGLSVCVELSCSNVAFDMAWLKACEDVEVVDDGLGLEVSALGVCEEEVLGIELECLGLRYGLNRSGLRHIGRETPGLGFR